MNDKVTDKVIAMPNYNWHKLLRFWQQELWRRNPADTGKEEILRATMFISHMRLPVGGQYTMQIDNKLIAAMKEDKGCYSRVMCTCYPSFAQKNVVTAMMFEEEPDYDSVPDISQASEIWEWEVELAYRDIDRISATDVEFERKFFPDFLINQTGAYFVDGTLCEFLDRQVNGYRAVQNNEIRIEGGRQWLLYRLHMFNQEIKDVCSDQEMHLRMSQICMQSRKVSRSEWLKPMSRWRITLPEFMKQWNREAMSRWGEVDPDCFGIPFIYTRGQKNEQH